MSVRIFLGKVRRKILRFFLGKELLTIPKQLENIMASQLPAMGGKLEQQHNAILRINRGFYHELTGHIYNAALVKEVNTKAFSKYRSIYRNREVVVMGTGPTLNYYEPLENCITIGVNRTVLFEKVKLDYLFVQDFNSLDKVRKEILEYKCKKFFRFLGGYPWNLSVKYRDMPDMEEYYAYNFDFLHDFGYFSAWEENNIPWPVDGFLDFLGYYVPLDICNFPLVDFWSVIFPAVQFAFWTYPKRIYLVGCDSSREDFFKSSMDDNNTEFLQEWRKVWQKMILKGWEKIKEFWETSYPDVEIISINPVGLKGMFKDMYTQSYLVEHPEFKEQV
jgi:hypothetical protein